MSSKTDLECRISQQNVTADASVCRDFLRNVCKRGRRCKFTHPPQLLCDKIRRSERIFCHDYQNAVCRRPACKFLHYSREEEEIFRLTGRLPGERESTSDGTLPPVTNAKPPVCKDYLSGCCIRGSSCKYRHIASHAKGQILQCETSTVPRGTVSDDTYCVVPDFGPVTCTSVPSCALSSAITDGVSFGLPPSTMITMSISESVSARPSFSQSSKHSTNPAFSNQPLRTPVGDVCFGSYTSATPVVGVVGHCGLPSQSLQHTLYAHSPSFGAYAPLGSVPSTSQPVPCSSVLAVVADPTQHPAVLQHPSAVPNPQATFLLSNTVSPIPSHILSSSSSVSSAPALLTIPFSHFECNSSASGTILSPHATADCPAIFSNVLPTNGTVTNTSGAYFPSYNFLRITPSTSVATLPLFPGQHVVTESTPVVSSSSTTAVLAAAAAAGYLAQHLPTMAGNTGACTNASSDDTSCGLEIRYGPQEDLRVDNTQESVALAAAANIPAVSAAAAAAAVAAAKVFVARTLADEHTLCATLNSQLIATQAAQPRASLCSFGTETDSLGTGTLPSAIVPAQLYSNSAVDTLATATTSLVQSISSSSVLNVPYSPSSSPHFSHRALRDEENAKTAAAVAAAACIGAMFSQPLGTATSNPSTVAAMLGDLMNTSHRTPGQLFVSPKNLESERSFSQLDTDGFAGERESRSSHPSAADQKYDPKSYEHMSTLLTKSGDEDGSVSKSGTTANGGDNPSTMSSGSENHSFVRSHVDFSNSSPWSSVATTVASAAQAAAAAAVAATAAVTHSAKFFQLSRKRNSTTNFDSLKSPCAGFSHALNSSTSAGAPACQLPISQAESDRTGLSPNTAVTMTNAAAAAAMAAAAVSVAAKQRQLLSEMQHSTFSEDSMNASPRQPKNADCQKNSYNAENYRFPVTHGADVFLESNRRPRSRPCFGYFQRLRDTSCVGALEDEEDDEDPDVSEDDPDNAMSIFPSGHSSLHDCPRKLCKLSDRLDAVFVSPTDESRTASDTSPSESFDHELSPHVECRDAALITHRSNFNRHSSDRQIETSQLPSLSRAGRNDSVAVELGGSGCDSCRDTRLPSRQLCPRRHATSFARLVSDSVQIFPSRSPAGSLRRSRSMTALSTSVLKKLGPIRPNSTPGFVMETVSTPSKPLSSGSPTNPQIAVTVDEQLCVVPSQGVHISEPKSRNYLSNLHDCANLKNAPRCPRTSVSSSKSHRLSKTKSNALSRRLNSGANPPVRRRMRDRPQAIASPDSILTEDYYQCGMDEVEYMDTEDEDIFELRARKSSLQRSVTSQPARTKLSKSTGATISSNSSYSSTSVQKQRALKAENSRLRRKLFELLRQRGDLRAANEILLEQNARLRHSSKRASAVARMAESATKIIEAHSKSRLAKPGAHPLSSGHLPSTTEAPRSSDHFSITQAAAAAAAAVAAAQQRPSIPPVRGAYVSSPTAATQQAPPAIISSAIPGAIALSSHQPLTAMHIQPTGQPQTYCSVSTQLSVIGAQSVDSRQNTVQNFYEHQMPHPVGSIPVSITNIPHHPSMTVPSTIQVCHYPISSSGAVFSSLPQITAVTPSIVPIGAPNAVTLLVGRPPAALAPVHTALHLPNNTVATETVSVNFTPVPCVYHGTPSRVFSSDKQYPPAGPVTKVEHMNSEDKASEQQTDSSTSGSLIQQ